MTFKKFMATPSALAFSLALAVPAFANDKNYDEKFKEVDANSDGKISTDEYTADVKKKFDEMDEDKDGKVTAAEMTARHDKMMTDQAKAAGKDKKTEKSEMSSADKIKELDTDNDGILSSTESSEGATVMFRRLDTNKDGFLTKAEYSAGRDRYLKKKSS